MFTRGSESGPAGSLVGVTEDAGLFAAGDAAGHAPPSPAAGDVDPSAPLAVRMRPRTLDEVIGQEHLLRPNSPLRRLVEGRGGSSLILYGPPGTGKTTLANLVASTSGRHFVALSALSAGVK
ncbi:AAA family ATPase, partial [Dietzia maris]|uniref:AAA family ATPase n=2 Tax=Dietziaceae TaxID=85029 RepID=UPI00341CEDB0